MNSSFPMLLALLALMALAGREALLDKTPRSPRRELWAFIAQRPDLPFWAKRRSKTEAARVAVSFGKEA